MTGYCSCITGIPHVHVGKQGAASFEVLANSLLQGESRSERRPPGGVAANFALFSNISGTICFVQIQSEVPQGVLFVTRNVVLIMAMKNQYLISQNLQEAKDQIEQILNDLAANPGYSEEMFKVCLEHVYHHLNFSWNIRNLDESRVELCAEDDFREWSKYPQGEILEYGKHFLEDE